jgi:glycine/D-amino acid oxidase-like deaminating enzyme
MAAGERSAAPGSDRRRFLAGSVAMLLAGCTQTERFSAPLQPAGRPLLLAPVAVAPDRIIRRVVGLRPFRPGGFVLRAERLGDKLLVHDYGHGGGGVTLSWGTAALAADLAGPVAGTGCAVLGCGAVGLATARTLQERGARVTIYARALPPDTTSNVAGAQWWPSFVFDRGAITAAFAAQYVQAAHLAYQRFQTLPGARYGIRWTRNYAASDDPPDPEGADPATALADLCVECGAIPPDETPFPGLHVRQFDTMMIEPPIYLPAMMRDVREAGGAIVLREIAGPRDILALPEPVVFNCTGLGAGAIFGDTELVPVKGQLTVLLPQPEVTYNALYRGSYMFPRQDGVLLGGTEQRGDRSLAPDLAAEARIMRDQLALYAHLRR